MKPIRRPNCATSASKSGLWATTTLHGTSTVFAAAVEVGDSCQQKYCGLNAHDSYCHLCNTSIRSSLRAFLVPGTAQTSRDRPQGSPKFCSTARWLNQLLPHRWHLQTIDYFVGTSNPCFFWQTTENVYAFCSKMQHVSNVSARCTYSKRCALRTSWVLLNYVEFGRNSRDVQTSVRGTIKYNMGGRNLVVLFRLETPRGGCENKEQSSLMRHRVVWSNSSTFSRICFLFFCLEDGDDRFSKRQ